MIRMGASILVVAVLTLAAAVARGSLAHCTGILSDPHYSDSYCSDALARIVCGFALLGLGGMRTNRSHGSGVPRSGQRSLDALTS